MSYGFRGHIGIGAEVTAGTAVAATDYFTALSESLKTDVQRLDVQNIIGGYYEPDDDTGLSRHSGNIVAAGFPKTVGWFAKGALGVNSVSSLGSGLFRNDFTFLTADVSSLAPVPAYTIEIYRDVGSSQQFAGGQVSQLAISVAANQEMRLTAQLVAMKQANIAATTPTFPNSPTGPFIFKTASLSLGGVGITRVEAFTLTLDNNLEGVPSLNATSEINKIKRTRPQMVRVTGTLGFEDQTDLDAFRAQTEQQLRIYFTRAASFSMLIDIPRFVYSEFPTGIGGRDRLTVDFTGIGRYHTGSLNAVKLSLTTVNTF